jgi:hypothetical protein
MSLVAGIEVLKYASDVEDLAVEYEHRLGLAGSGTSDLPHFAYSIAYNMDYLLTWNCAHIANGQIIKRLLEANQDLGRPTPVIVTPVELMAYPANEDD